MHPDTSNDAGTLSPDGPHPRPFRDQRAIKVFSAEGRTAPASARASMAAKVKAAYFPEAGSPAASRPDAAPGD